jgi:hypothetical protein
MVRTTCSSVSPGARKFLRPTLREQLEDGVREALRRYADRRTAPNLRVFVSTDLIPEGMDPALWARDEAEHLRRFALQWARTTTSRAGLRLEVILLDTKREFAFVKPMGLERAGRRSGGSGPPMTAAAAPAPPLPRRPRWPRGGARRRPLLEVVSSGLLGAAAGARRGDVGAARRRRGCWGSATATCPPPRAAAGGGRPPLGHRPGLEEPHLLNDRAAAPARGAPAASATPLRMGTTTLRVARVEA